MGYRVGSPVGKPGCAAAAGPLESLSVTSLDALVRPDRYPRASGYDPGWLVGLDMGPNPLWLLEDLARDLEPRPGMRVLDLGPGVRVRGRGTGHGRRSQAGAGPGWSRAGQEPVRSRAGQEPVGPEPGQAE
ncbi:MAG: hypothetical protein QOC85_3331 [Streptomyces sp.]|nr:hypothetical protein [Streptomyces sp.]